MKKNNAILGVVFLIFHCLMARGAPLLSDENGLAPLPVTNERKSYAIVTDPRNALSIATIRQLQPCHIYMVCVPKDRETAERVVQRLQTVEPKTYEITICTFDPFGTKERVQASAMECIRKINCRDQLDGVLFNPYGSVGDGNPRPGTGLLALSEYKLIGNAILLQALLSQRILKEKSRIIFSGSEAARYVRKTRG